MLSISQFLYIFKNKNSHKNQSNELFNNKQALSH